MSPHSLQETTETFTPGPWTYDKAPRVGAADGCEIRTVAVTAHTAKLTGPTFVGAAYSEADARLMAAAPDLLAALKGCVSMLTAMAHATGTGFECLGPAHDAIDRVKGGV